MKNISDNFSVIDQSMIKDDLILYVPSWLGPKYNSIDINVIARQESLSLEEIQFLMLSHEMCLEQQYNVVKSEVDDATANLSIYEVLWAEKDHHHHSTTTGLCFPSRHLNHFEEKVMVVMEGPTNVQSANYLKALYGLR